MPPYDYISPHYSPKKQQTTYTPLVYKAAYTPAPTAAKRAATDTIPRVAPLCWPPPEEPEPPLPPEAAVPLALRLPILAPLTPVLFLQASPESVVALLRNTMSAHCLTHVRLLFSTRSSRKGSRKRKALTLKREAPLCEVVMTWTEAVAPSVRFSGASAVWPTLERQVTPAPV